MVSQVVIKTKQSNAVPSFYCDGAGEFGNHSINSVSIDH